MAGHSKWAQIKHHKGIADQKRGQLFSKLLNAISAAARADPNPEFNPHLRAAIQKAKEHNVPSENIERAIKRATEATKGLEELILEAYGPGGVAILMEAITDNRNRTTAEVKKTLSEMGGKWAEVGSVRWAFEEVRGGRAGRWQTKFFQSISAEDKQNLAKLVAAIEELGDVERVYTNQASS